jgi:orotate phosphoribosyltransferase
MKKELIDRLCEKSFKYTAEPSFKLVSGRLSRFYVNCKPTTLSPRGMFLVGHLMFEAIRDVNPAGVGGLTFGADPIAMATAFASEIKGQPIQAFSIRKTKKDHGIAQWVEGRPAGRGARGGDRRRRYDRRVHHQSHRTRP